MTCWYWQFGSSYLNMRIIKIWWTDSDAWTWLMSRSQFPRDRDRSLKSGPNSVGAGAVRAGPDIAGVGAGAGFRSRDRIYNGIHLNFGIKYYRMHEKVGAGSEEAGAGAGAVKDRSQPGPNRNRSRSCKDGFQIVLSTRRTEASSRRPGSSFIIMRFPYILQALNVFKVPCCASFATIFRSYSYRCYTIPSS